MARIRRGASFVSGVAVGTAVTRCPPHRPVLALLTHTVPTSNVWPQTAPLAKGVESRPPGWRCPAAPESAPRSNGSAGSAGEAGAATAAARRSESSSVVAGCPVKRDIGNTRELKWTPLSRPFFGRNKLWIGGSDLRSGAAGAAPAIPALESALGSHSCGALSSAQVPPL